MAARPGVYEATLPCRIALATAPLGARLGRASPAGTLLSHWLPGGRSLLFKIVPEHGGLDAAKIAILDLVTGATRTVLEGGYAARYVDSGHLVYAAVGALWGARFDLSRLETQAAPIDLLRPLTIGRTGAASELDIAANGTVAYSRGTILGSMK